MNITITTPNSDKETTYAKPKIGENTVKVMAVVNLGLVKAKNPTYKDQNKFILYFATPEGAQLRNEFSATWGENSRWRIFCSSWAGKDLLNPINPQDLLGCQGTAVVVPNGKFFNINTILPGLHKKSNFVFPGKVFISSLLKSRGTAFEIATAQGVVAEVVVPVAKAPEINGHVMVQALKAASGQSFETVNAFGGAQSQMLPVAPTVVTAAFSQIANGLTDSKEVSEDDLPF